MESLYLSRDLKIYLWDELQLLGGKNIGLAVRTPNLLVKGKGNKERYTYIPYNLIASNLEFLLTKPKDSEYVFTISKGSICNRSSLYIIVDHLLTKAGISKSGLHIFRHTFARSLVDKDVTLSTIKDLLGHSNISITAQFYAKSNENAKRNALMKLKRLEYILEISIKIIDYF